MRALWELNYPCLSMFAGSIQGASDTRGPEVQRVNTTRAGRVGPTSEPCRPLSAAVMSTRRTHRNESASWQARGRARPRPARAPMAGCGLGRRRIRSWRLRGSGKRPLPEPPPGIVNVSLNLSRALRVATRWAPPTHDRTRPTKRVAISLRKPHESQVVLHR